MEYSIPTYVTKYLTDRGYSVPLYEMNGYIETWRSMLRCEGEFWNYNEPDGTGRTHKVHRMTVHPARRICNEYASLIADEGVEVSTDSQECTDYLKEYFEASNFFANLPGLISDAYGLGTGALVLWYNSETGEKIVRRYDARMVIPITYDEDRVSECAFASVVIVGGKVYNQLQMHVLEAGEYHIKTVLFDPENKKEILLDGMVSDFNTGAAVPWFAIVKPAIANNLVDFSPYGQSVFHDAVDVLKSVDITFDALITEVNNGARMLFVSDFLLETKKDSNGAINYHFSNRSKGVFRAVQSAEDMVKDFAPALRVQGFEEAYHEAVRNMGDQCGFGPDYFVADKSGGLKTAKEVSASQAVLMRNIKKHERVFAGSLVDISRAVLSCARLFNGVALPDEGVVRVTFDDSIIEDTATEKANDLAEVGVTMNAWEYRAKWYGEDEETAKANVPGATDTAGFFSLSSDGAL